LFPNPLSTRWTQIHPVEGEANGTVCSGFVNGLLKHFSIRGRFSVLPEKPSQIAAVPNQNSDSDPFKAFTSNLPPREFQLLLLRLTA
jgi:hypothetical protein